VPLIVWLLAFLALKARMLTDLAQPFTHIVPLGVSCRVTHQIRRCFGVGVAYPFDWWISPLSGLVRYLEDPEPARIYSPGCLEEMKVDGRVTAIRSREFGIELFHEFPRTRIVVDGQEVSTVAEDWREHVSGQREKHETRLRRLLATDAPGNRILFIRHKYDANPEAQASSREIMALQEALQKRWSAARVELMLLNVPVSGAIPQGVRIETFEDLPGPAPDEWQGDAERWGSAFAAQQLRLDGAVPADAPRQWSNGPPD
jgi:hypothetical protein